MGRASGNESTAFLVGAVADPTKRGFFKVTVGRATVPANRMSITGCGLARDHTPGPGLKRSLVVAIGWNILSRNLSK
jgi:hypothetical protein